MKKAIKLLFGALIIFGAILIIGIPFGIATNGLTFLGIFGFNILIWAMFLIYYTYISPND